MARLAAGSKSGRGRSSRSMSAGARKRGSVASTSTSAVGAAARPRGGRRGRRRPTVAGTPRPATSPATLRRRRTPPIAPCSLAEPGGVRGDDVSGPGCSRPTSSQVPADDERRRRTRRRRAPPTRCRGPPTRCTGTPRHVPTACPAGRISGSSARVDRDGVEQLVRPVPGGEVEQPGRARARGLGDDVAGEVVHERARGA